MELEHFPAEVPAAEVGDHLRRYGYAIVDDLADAATMDQLYREVAPFIDASDAGRDEYDGRFTRRTARWIARSPTARRLVMHPTAVGAAQHLLSQATTIQLHLTQVITISPGETRQKLHRDQMAFDFYPFPPGYHVQCNTMWALTDFTEDNGATHILPGTSGMDDESGLRKNDNTRSFVEELAAERIDQDATHPIS
jgi:ectoine hydroxylase-related dioxygenase (phytanoyl-CoA dioxygenase family)